MKQIIKKIVTTILAWEARMVLKKYRPRVVAVTGSVGKTSTKDAIALVLSRFYRVWKSEKSYNSDIGVPLTILGCKNAWGNPLLWLKNFVHGIALIVLPNAYPEWLVVEVGADRPRDIKDIVAWLSPDISVLTSIGTMPVHIEFFSSLEQLVEEKSWLVRGLRKGGAVILGGDDEAVRHMRSLTHDKVIIYGLGEHADVKASNERVVYRHEEGRMIPEGMVFKVSYSGNVIPVRVQEIISRHQIYAVLAAFAVGIALDANLLDIAESFERYQGPPGRMKIIDGNKNSIIVDDTYNSSPIAVEMALGTLKNLECKGKKIAVLGDMMELGKYSVEAHKAAGFIAARTCDILVAVGIRSRFTAEAALHEGMRKEHVITCDTAIEAGKIVDSIIEPGDIILVKGSQYMRMERAVEEIMAHPELKEFKLVRQEKEWISRK